MSDKASYVSYEEPSIQLILVLASFFTLLCIVGHALDSIVYCGLVGQILIGTAYGTPGLGWLPHTIEPVFIKLGYLGLILMVFEGTSSKVLLMELNTDRFSRRAGGLSTSLPNLRRNIWLSTGVAATGIGLPYALSFVLIPLADATRFQAFAAGTALCSTSLGTTFTVLASSGLVQNRLGVILSTAAMLDDVVGLVLVQVILTYGTTSINDFDIARPVVAAIGVTVVLFLICRFGITTLASAMHKWSNLLRYGEKIKLAIMILLLVGLVAGSSYAGASTLYACYLSGVVMTWLDDQTTLSNISAATLYSKHFSHAVETILKPLFFVRATVHVLDSFADSFPGFNRLCNPNI